MSEMPIPPFVEVEGINNFRDVGGYPIADHPSSSVRRHTLYRCAQPSGVTDAGKSKLKSLGITTFFDLRSKPELAKLAATTPVRPIEGIERQFVPAFAELDYSPENIALRYKDYSRGGPEGFTRAYKEILAHAQPSFRTIILHLRDHPDRPCVIHCTAGKDRTGVIIALVLSLVGVDDNTIAREYALTEQGLMPMRPMIMEHLMSEPSLALDKEAAMRMVSSTKENMLAVLDMIRETYGSAEAYFKNQCGLSDQDITTIQQNLTSDEPPVL